MSRGAVESASENGLTSLGLVIVTSSLHHDTGYENSVRKLRKRKTPIIAYTLDINDGVLNVEPTRSHDLALDNKQLKRACIRAKYTSDIGAGEVGWNLSLWCLLRKSSS